MSNSDQVVAQIGAWVAGGTQVGWTNFQPASTLAQWKRGATKTAAPVPAAMGPNVDMVCYELPFWAAYHSGVWSKDKLWDVVEGHPDNRCLEIHASAFSRLANTPADIVAPSP